MNPSVPQSAWNKFNAAMRSQHEGFNQADLIWVRNPNDVPEFNEDLRNGGQRITLKVLIGFNNFRTWPITRTDTGGQADVQNQVALINRQYLRELGYLNSSGYLDFKPDRDYFFHMGIRYKSEGDTPLAQAFNDPVLMMLILRREEVETGEKQFNQTANEAVIVVPPLIQLIIKTLTPE